MMKQETRSSKSRPLTTFFLLTFAIAWGLAALAIRLCPMVGSTSVGAHCGIPAPARAGLSLVFLATTRGLADPQPIRR